MPPKKRDANDKKKLQPKGPKGMPKPVDSGLIITDLRKGRWKLGTKIDQGGFGYLHLGSAETDRGKGSKVESHVIKVEPQSNGPLFVELAFYQRVAKPEIIEGWKKKGKLKHLGIPPYLGSGIFDFKGTKYRFLVMERYAENVEKKFLSCGKSFSLKTVLSLGIVMLDCLEFLHENEYVHADIKGSNMLTGFGKKEKDLVFLVDYGLAYRYSPIGVHVQYLEDPKRKHDGTIEYTSRDAHLGVAPSRRGDLEILGYCMVQWLAGSLPWEGKISNKETVFQEKKKFMKDVSKSLHSCFAGNTESIDELVKYLNYVKGLKYEEKPDYRKVKSIFSEGLRKRRLNFDGMNVEFSAHTAPKASRKRPLTNRTDDEDDQRSSPQKKAPTTARASPGGKKGKRSPATTGRTRVVRRKPRNIANLVDKATSP